MCIHEIGAFLTAGRGRQIPGPQPSLCHTQQKRKCLFFKRSMAAMLQVLRALAHEKVNYFQKGNRKHVQGEKTEINIGETVQAEVVASC